METNRRLPFGIQLRQFREAAGLSQEQLAERAGLSLRGISDLERGLRTTPRLETVRMLADGLALDEAERRQLLAARNFSNDGERQHSIRRLSAVPVPTTSFIGRKEEVEAIVRLIEIETPRLLTLTGPGGVGKTRIAIEVAHRLKDSFASGTIFVDISSVRKPEMVIPAIADQLGIIGQANVAIGEILAVTLHDRPLLMVLDNLEQVIDAATDIAWLITVCPHLTVLVTSRVLLRLAAEHVIPVDPMTLPGPDPVSLIHQSDAVRLFVSRARAVDHLFTLSTDNVTAIAEVVARLQGLPLAIELAAARLRLLTMTELLNRLDSQLPVLTSGDRDVPERHRTMRDTITWSYNLLSMSEQAVFRSLAIFPDGCTLETAVAIGAAEGSFS